MPEVGEIMNRMRTGNARYVAEGRKPRDCSVERDAVASRTVIVSVLTCSDIKVAPEQVFGHEIGDLIVIQSAAGGRSGYTIRYPQRIAMPV